MPCRLAIELVKRESRRLPLRVPFHGVKKGGALSRCAGDELLTRRGRAHWHRHGVRTTTGISASGRRVYQYRYSTSRATAVRRQVLWTGLMPPQTVLAQV